MFHRSSLRFLLTYFCLFALVASSAPLARAGNKIAASTSIVAMSSGEAAAALAQGRNLFSNGQDDMAFVQLDAALKGFTAANDFAGSAAAEDALGDIYTRTGQYAEALKHFTAARDLFQKANDTDNVNVLLAKIGETNFLSGDLAAARAAFAAMNVITPAQAAQNAEAQNKTDKSAGGMKPAMSGIAAVCSAPQGDTPNNGNNPGNPPNMGRAPARFDGIGRLHAQVLDEAGNPMKGVNLDLKSKRPDGFRCNCVNSTDPFGYSVLPPLHIGEVKLVLKAPGLPTQELPLKPEDLKEIVRVQLTRNGAQLVKQAAQNSVQSAGAASCFNLYRAFSLFGTSRLGQGRADYESGNLAAAKASYEDLLKQLNLPGAETLSMTPRFRAAALTALGDIALKEKRFDDATKIYTEARDGAKTANRLDLMWAAQRGIGQGLWQQTQAATDSNIAAKLRSETAVAYREAIKTIEQIRQGSMRADEARTTFLASTKDVYDEAAEVITELALVAAGLPTTTADAAKPATILNGYALTLAAESFKISEQARARSLLDMLAESRTRITADVAPAIAKRRSEITARQSEIVRILTGASLAADRATVTVPVLEAELARLSGEQEALENQIRTASARYANLTAGRPLTLAEVQQQVLDNQTVLLAFSLGKTASTMWAVTREGITVQRLPSREIIEAEAMKLRAQLIPEGLRRSIVGIDVTSANNPEAKENSSSNASDPASFASVAHTLYNMTVAPVASLVGNKRILVVADGALNYVPFEALVTGMPTDAANGDYSSLSYLIKTNEVMYAPSASVVAALRAQRAAATSNKGGSVLVVADPVFSLEDLRVKSAANAAKKPTADTVSRTRGLLLSSALADVSKNAANNMHLVRLNGTRTEANEIATLARTAGSTAEVWLDFDASEQNVLARNMQQYRVLHFATHGILNAERPQFTGLAFSLVGEQGNDGFLRVNEVFNFKLGQPLVMLSACETGLGKEKRGEGVIGLTRAFMYAGAPTVGVSLWSVSDRSTARLMGDFYKEIFANNATPGTALRTAQVAMINNPRYSAPFFWAPFVLVGDWK